MAGASSEGSRRLSTLAVYDCMMFFRAASRPGRVRPIFDLVAEGSVTLCFSAAVLAEILDVLTRPKLVARYPALTAIAVDAFLTQFLRAALWIADVPEAYVLERDPKDSKYINLAIASGARFLVTSDLDLLELMATESAAGRDFRSRFPDIQILTPADFQLRVRE